MDLSKARDELEQLVINANSSRVDVERVKRFAPDLRAENDEDLLTELIRTNKPDDVLFYCFYEYDLQRIAIEQSDKKIKKEENLKGGELIRAILEKVCGYPPQVVPIGLYQVMENINPTLEKAENSHLQLSHDLDGLGVGMGKTIEQLLPELFRFYLGALRRKNINNNKIEELCNRYSRGGTDIGLYIGFKKNEQEKCGYLTELMYIIKNDEELRKSCTTYFQRDEILTISQIAEIGMCMIYRHVFSHYKLDRWNSNKRKGDKNLSQMDAKTCGYWKENWNNVVQSMEKQVLPNDLIKREMLQKMAGFLRQFLNMLSEERIYPRVIVMTSSSIDEFEHHIITADSSNPDDETFFLTDCEFIPRTQFFYKPRTNPVGIEPILAPKEDLVKWATKSNKEIEKENQDEA